MEIENFGCEVQVLDGNREFSCEVQVLDGFQDKLVGPASCVKGSVMLCYIEYCAFKRKTSDDQVTHYFKLLLSIKYCMIREVKSSYVYLLFDASDRIDLRAKSSVRRSSRSIGLSSLLSSVSIIFSDFIRSALAF